MLRLSQCSPSRRPGWTDQQIADAFRCRRQTVENVLKKCVVEGFEQALEHQQQRKRKPKTFDGGQEAQVIALRLGELPKGYGRRTLRLLAHQIVELEIAETVSHETIRQALKKTG